MKTIKQMADTLGLDKQRVYRYIRKNHINEAHQEAGVMWYDEAVESLVSAHFLKSDCISEVHHTESNDTVVDTVIAMLQKELEVKNQQIAELTVALENTTAALRESQTTTNAAQALHAGTMKKQLTDGSEKADGILSRIFRKRH